MRRAALIAAAAALGCAARSHVPRALPPLSDEAAIYVYLQPLPERAKRLTLSIGAVSLARSDGSEVPLELAAPEISGAQPARQRLLASRRVPAGRYGALVLKVRRATVAGDEGPVDLLLPDGTVRVDLAGELPPGSARVVQLSLADAAPEATFDLAAALRARTLDAASSVVQLSGYVPSTASATLAVLDRRSKQVTAVIPTGREPQGIAVDVLAQRAYLALGGDDQVQVLDLATGHDLSRVQLRTGDEPRELALTPDGRTVVVINAQSSTATFVDTRTGTVSERVATGQEPWALLLGSGGRRAYVLNRRSNDLTVLDVGNRSVVTTVPTDPEPTRAALNRSESRLYVVHRGSAYMRVFSLPDLAPAGRAFVGLGVSAVRVDSRTDRIYVAREAEPRVEVFDPTSLVPMDSIALPGPASFLTIDDVENALVAVMPGIRAVAFVDLTSRRVVSVADVGPDPYQVAVVGERP